ncbi:sugar-binding protein [Victivallis vadensis]|uniref:sugar-binding protein n=1 Tax=Victivallis vadensis TaxID=172901 RepID=UPI00307EAB48
MRTIHAAVAILLLTVTLNSNAWWVTYQSNQVTATREQGQVRIGRNTQPHWGWKDSENIAFLFIPDGSDSLYAAKDNGKPGKFTLEFNFNQALKSFVFITPECRKVRLSAGDVIFGYSINDAPAVHELARITPNSPGYAEGATIAPIRCPEVSFTEAQDVRKLTLHFQLNGDVNYMMFAGADQSGSLIDYTIYNRLPVELLPDAVHVGNTYYIDSPPHLIFRIPVLGVTVFDETRNREAGVCRLEIAKDKTIARLPDDLRPGVYRLRSWNRVGVLPDQERRIALVQRPRELSDGQLLNSPFGMVYIDDIGSRRQGPWLDCPMIGEMLGIHQIRGGVWSWCAVARSPQKFMWEDPNWSRAWEATVKDWKSHKLVPRQNLSWTPEWAVDLSRVRPGTWSGHYPPKDEFLPDYEEFCRETVRRSVGAREYEIRNEPNNEPSGMWKGTFEEYVKLCKISADAVHSVDPNAKMILGSTADADIGYIARCFKAGLSPYYQIIDIHPYPHTRQAPELFLLNNIRDLQKLIRQYNGNQEIIFSEIGWPTQQFDTSAYERVSEFDQACFYSRTLLISLAGGVKQIYFYTVSDQGTDPANAEDNFGIVRNDSTPKLSLSAFSGTARHLEAAQFLGSLSTPISYFIWAWKNPWQPQETLLTVWADTQAISGRVSPLELPGILTQAEDLWGGVPNSDRVWVKDGKIHVQPGADPLFLYIKNFPENKLQPLPQTLRPIVSPRRAIAHYQEMLPEDKKQMAYTTNYPFGAQTLGYAGVNSGGKMIDQKTIHSKTSFSVGWNDREFLLNVRIKSDKPFRNNQSGWNVWAEDSVRLFISPDAVTPYLTGKHYQIGIAPETTGHGPAGAFVISYGNRVPVGEAIPGARVEARNVDGGWVMKAAIPWSAFGTVPKPGDVWRFDLISPNGVWNSPGDDKWHNAGNWGELQFSE